AQRDLAVLQMIIMLIAVVMITTNLIVDLAYAKLDPRTAAAAAH
ncbi:MAG: ABC transporter permease, partial [Devosia nanyangense]|nr:ABC transporter permease [Devosia nanyangense]